MTTPGSNGPDQQPGGGAPGWGQPPAGTPGGYSPPPPPGGASAPPPGAFPQGQYQPPPGAAPFPPQGGAPYPQGAFGAPRKSGPPKWLIPVIAGVVLVVGALVLFAFLGGAGEAEVGDCVTANSDNEVEVVDCGDDSALGKVIGVQAGEQSYSEYLADPNSCADFPDQIGSFWQGEEGEDGKVICVGAI